MRALHAYAPSDVSRLVYEEAPVPSPGLGDVLVRVHASGVSPAELDWRLTWRITMTLPVRCPSSRVTRSPGWSRRSGLATPQAWSSGTRYSV